VVIGDPTILSSRPSEFTDRGVFDTAGAELGGIVCDSLRHLLCAGAAHIWHPRAQSQATCLRAT